MKTVILCGGLGTRLAEETTVRPKPMVEIGGRPILWHVMKCYERHGHKDFVLALGHKSEVIKQYFLGFYDLSNDFKISLKDGKVEYLKEASVDWNVTLMDTGAGSMTGGRLHRLEKHLRPHGTFMLTYGDGVCDVDISKLIMFHKSHGKIATVTAVHPPARFGGIVTEGDRVSSFAEKPQTGEGRINGGYFVFEPGIFDYLEGDATILERSPMEQLTRDGQLMAFRHDGFWQCMDTIRDKQYLTELYESGQARWLK